MIRSAWEEEEGIWPSEDTPSKGCGIWCGLPWVLGAGTSCGLGLKHLCVSLAVVGRGEAPLLQPYLISVSLDLDFISST